MQTHSIKYAPTGVTTEKPIALRLLPEERKQVEVLASVNKQSKSAVARELLLAGLAAKQGDQAED